MQYTRRLFGIVKMPFFSSDNLVVLVALSGQKYDVAGLTRCARRLKDEVPDADTERQVLVTANPNVPFQEVVRVMDALRRDEKGELFPKVVFTVVN